MDSNNWKNQHGKQPFCDDFYSITKKQKPPLVLCLAVIRFLSLHSHRLFRVGIIPNYVNKTLKAEDNFAA